MNAPQLNRTQSSPEDRVCAVGLDVGGTKIAGGIVPLPSGRVLSRRIIQTRPERGGEAVLADALALSEDLIKEAAKVGMRVLGIGLGVCELVDPAGNVTSSQTIAWSGVPVQARLSDLAPAVVESDVRAAALAEALFGAGRPFKHFAYVTVGTGISSTLVEGGRPYAGARGNALVLASAPWSTICTNCGAHLSQVLEEYASGPALVARYKAASSTPVSRAEQVLAGAAANDPLAVELVRSAGEALGNSVGFLVNILDPAAIVVGGGLGMAGGLYWSSFESSTRRHIWSEQTRNLPILQAALGTDAGLIGAAASIWGKQNIHRESA